VPNPTLLNDGTVDPNLGSIVMNVLKKPVPNFFAAARGNSHGAYSASRLQYCSCMSTIAVHRSRRGPATRAATANKPTSALRAAGLTYATDDRPALARKRTGKTFRYTDPAGRPIRDPDTLSRIKSLVIPPAWEDVWICPWPLGHIQATGRDARGRKQYRYHPRWREVRDAAKYDRLMAFGRTLSRLRTRTNRDLALPGLPRRKVLAAVVQLLERSLIRVGNDEYAKNNHSFGLTTMRDKHVAFAGAKIEFQFTGKSGVHHEIDIHDRRLAKIVRRCQELPGQELFQYLDENGKVQDVDSADVNEYLKRAMGVDFTAKDFRTWAGTVLAAMALQEFEAFDSKAQAKKNIVRAIERVAERLGNTPTVCRKCYIHPAVLDSYLDGTMIEVLRQRADQEMEKSVGKLKPEEAAVLALLQNRLAREVKARTTQRSR
jgi:DNA topoisomerase I